MPVHVDARVASVDDGCPPRRALARGARPAGRCCSALVLRVGAGARRTCAKVPPLTARVTDLTSTLSAAERQALDAKLAAWEAKTGNQLVVLIVPSTQPEPIEAYSHPRRRSLEDRPQGPGQRRALPVAKNDRKMRIEVGYGFEGVLTDVTSRRIIGEDRRAAISATTSSPQASTPASTRSSPSSTRASRSRTAGGARRRSASARRHLDFGTLLILLFVVVPVIGGILRRIFGKAVGSTVGAGIVGARRVVLRRIAR